MHYAAAGLGLLGPRLGLCHFLSGKIFRLSIVPLREQFPYFEGGWEKSNDTFPRKSKCVPFLESEPPLKIFLVLRCKRLESNALILFHFILFDLVIMRYTTY